MEKGRVEPHYTFVVLALRIEHAAKLRQVRCVLAYAYGGIDTTRARLNGP